MKWSNNDLHITTHIAFLRCLVIGYWNVAVLPRMLLNWKILLMG